MVRIQRNHAEHAEVLVQHDDLFWRLDKLLGKESQHDRSRNPGRKAPAGGIVDAAPIERFENLLRSPLLIRCAFTAGRAIVR